MVIIISLEVVSMVEVLFNLVEHNSFMNYSLAPFLQAHNFMFAIIINLSPEMDIPLKYFNFPLCRLKDSSLSLLLMVVIIIAFFFSNK